MIEYNVEVWYSDGHVAVYTLDMSKANVGFWSFISDVWSDIDAIEIHKEYKYLGRGEM